jgi:hypothetical protein
MSIKEVDMYKLTKIQPINCKIDISPFLLGVARIFDFTQSLGRPGKLEPDEVDREALQSDWDALGDDMHKSMKTVMG